MAEILDEFKRLMTTMPGERLGNSIEILLQLMPATSAAHLRLCAVPHEFNPQILQVLVPDMSAAQAKERCEEFSTLSIVTAGSEDLAFHDAVRRELFAQWLKPERHEEFIATSARLMMYFAEVAASASGQPKETLGHRHMFHLLGADQAKGFIEFESLCRQARHNGHLSTCTNLISRVHEYDPVLAPERVPQLAYHEGKLASDLRQWERAQRLFESVLASETSSSELSTKALIRLGFIFGELREWSSAIDYYQRALKIANHATGSNSGNYQILNSLGEAYRDSGDLTHAEELLAKSIKLAQEADDMSAMATAFNSLGTLHFKNRNITRATEAYEKSLQCLNHIGDRFRCAQVYNNLGMVSAEQGNWEEADRFYQQSLEIKRLAGDTLGQARTLINLVRIYRNSDRFTQGVDFCLKAIALFGEIHDVHGLAEGKRTLGKLYRAMNQFDLSRKALTEAAELFESCHARDEAYATRQERDTLERTVGIPWWAWMFVAIFVGAILTLVMVIAVFS